MMGRGNIVWLASYPKSGNTWVRLLLGNLLGLQKDEEDDFAPVAGISSNRIVFDRLVGINSTDLSQAEIDRLRPDFYRRISDDAGRLTFLKAHDSYQFLPNGQPFFPRDCARAVIYIVRDPLDVAVSWAHHRGHGDFDRAIKNMGDPSMTLGGGSREQLLQHLGDWSDHYRSWTSQTEIPVCVVRYEDLRADTAAALSRIAVFAGIEESDFTMTINDAVDAARFERLQKIEDEKGFSEKPVGAARFFRSGRSGEGKEALTADQQRDIRNRHADLMRELNYLEGELG